MTSNVKFIFRVNDTTHAYLQLVLSKINGFGDIQYDI